MGRAEVRAARARVAALRARAAAALAEQRADEAADARASVEGLASPQRDAREDEPTEEELLALELERGVDACAAVSTHTTPPRTRRVSTLYLSLFHKSLFRVVATLEPPVASLDFGEFTLLAKRR